MVNLVTGPRQRLRAHRARFPQTRDKRDGVGSRLAVMSDEEYDRPQNASRWKHGVEWVGGGGGEWVGRGGGALEGF